MAHTSASPQGCTYFKLRQLLRSVSRLYDAEIGQAGLKGTQFSLLGYVLALGPVNPGELAERMGLDGSTLTRNLRLLQEQGWVRQGPGANARERRVEITPEGQAKHAEARVHWKRAQQLLALVVSADPNSLNQVLEPGEVAHLHAAMDRAQALLHDREHGGADPAA